MLQTLKTQNELKAAGLLMPEFFAGATRAWGFFETALGQKKKSFVADLCGRWDGEVFLLEETFEFSDGTTDERTWELLFNDDGTFNATCADAIAPGSGTHFENGFSLNYKVRLPVGTRKVVVAFDDVFHLIDDQTLLNRAKVSKWGIPVGQLLIAFRKNETALT